MNGYIELKTLEGDTVIVNVDRVSFVRKYRGGDDACALNFEKGHYLVVTGSMDEVLQALVGG